MSKNMVLKRLPDAFCYNLLLVFKHTVEKEKSARAEYLNSVQLQEQIIM